MTTGYTPTTARVRSDYGENSEGTSEARLDAFDRWLAEVRAKAWDEGESAGTSRAMRYMSDEPHLSTRFQNPYREDRA